MTSATHTIRARWILPVDAEEIENGTIEIRDGCIAAIHGKHDPAVMDLGNAAVIPGLVNAHTHLEFNELSAPLLPARPFDQWIHSLVAYRQSRRITPAESAARGFAESRHAGITSLGEIATAGWSLDAFTPPGPRTVLFRELIALLPERIDSQLTIAREFLQAEPSPARIIRGLSPHAPYSVHPDLYHALVDLADEFQAPLAIHLAETADELQLLADGTGPLARMMEAFGSWRSDLIPAGSRPMDYLRPLDRLERALVVHGNYLADDEIVFVAEHANVAVVYCPRTHHFFGHPEHPWRKLLTKGALVALGTDSRASNPDLSLWREMLFLHDQHADVDPRTLLRLGTMNGARALGFESETGSLTVGKAADLAVIALPDEPATDPYRLLFSPRSRVSAVMIAGNWVVEPEAESVT